MSLKNHALLCAAVLCAAVCHAEEKPQTTNISGGRLLPYEILPLAGDWEGDGYLWGGLDGSVSLADDMAAVLVQGVGKQKDVEAALTQDFSVGGVQVSIGMRRNERQAKTCHIYWDGALLATCHPNAPGEGIDKPERVSCEKGAFNFAPGKHTLRFEVAEASDKGADNFQVDAIRIEALPMNENVELIALEGMSLVAESKSALVAAAIQHFQKRLVALGGKALPVAGQANRPSLVVGGSVPADAQAQEALLPFQREESFYLALDSGNLIASGLGEMGAVYALSDIETRLRIVDGKLFVVAPAWTDANGVKTFFSKPAFEMRGEYINVGYNEKGITPHEWTREQWNYYVDQLVLAKLNRLCFYIWVDTYTMYPGSELSKNPLNRKIHEDWQYVIDYAHQRGLKVTYMICGTMIPRDLWLAHPEYKADIVYTEHGFTAVCPNAPGSWELCLDVWKSEMAWFSKADTLQIWYYDPGGCWCEKYGCKEHQVESLIQQTIDLSGFFWELNPQADIEANTWPMWLWEEEKDIKYKKAFSQELKKAFGEKANRLRVIGAPDVPACMPLEAREEGLDTGIFLFGVNPEMGYVFTVPTVNFSKVWINEIYKNGFLKTFSHRLEAWTRYPGTFITAEYMWDPSISEEQAARTYADWQAADASLGLRFAELILALDTFTEKGATVSQGVRMAELKNEIFPQLPAVTQQELEYWPAMIDALGVIAASVDVQSGYELQLLSRQFIQCLKESSTLAYLADNGKAKFMTYRKLLSLGQQKGRF